MHKHKVKVIYLVICSALRPILVRIHTVWLNLNVIFDKVREWACPYQGLESHVVEMFPLKPFDRSNSCLQGAQDTIVFGG